MMASISSVDVDMVELMNSMTIQVKVKRAKELRVRFWLACKLIALAALILNCAIEIDGEVSG